jgi:hypothetical protein
LTNNPKKEGVMNKKYGLRKSETRRRIKKLDKLKRFYRNVWEKNSILIVPRGHKLVCCCGSTLDQISVFQECCLETKDGRRFPIRIPYLKCVCGRGYVPLDETEYIKKFVLGLVGNGYQIENGG